MCREAKRNYERGIAEQAKSQPKAFWKFTKTKLRTTSGVAPLLADPKDPKSLCHDDKEKAEILQKQFVSVFTREPAGPTPRLPIQVHEGIATPHISRSDILKELSSINVSKSCFPESLKNYLTT